jgi:phosphatidylserine decarboxylase
MKHKKQDIFIYNKGKLEREDIIAEKWMRFIYENPVGRATLLFLVTRKAVSRLYGSYCRTKHSAKSIPNFIRDNKIDMTGCKESYDSFEEFFTRTKNDVSFPNNSRILGSPCEGLASVYTNIVPEKSFLFKGNSFSLADLFQSELIAESYRGGCMLSLRLTPANYHWMHFFDDGIVTKAKAIDGALYSVSPIALGKVTRLYCRNKRALIHFTSENFGNVTLVEIGATFVGSIKHCFEANQQILRGQQASYFKPGGSLVLLFFMKDTFIPNQALLENTKSGFETKVLVGMPLGKAAE